MTEIQFDEFGQLADTTYLEGHFEKVEFVDGRYVVIFEEHELIMTVPPIFNDTGIRFDGLNEKCVGIKISFIVNRIMDITNHIVRIYVIPSGSRYDWSSIISIVTFSCLVGFSYRLRIGG